MDPGHWEKTLWKVNTYPDNYVPPALFLASLRKNHNFKPYPYWHLVLLSCAVTQHLAVSFIFLAIFIRLKDDMLDPRMLVWISVGCFLTGYTIWTLLDHSSKFWLAGNVTNLKALKSSILIFLALMSLSPVLRTLTAATSSDSIWALSAVLLVMNAVLADYSSVNQNGLVHERLTSVLSMNAAVSASVVLASRLSADISVFALILFSVQAFSLFPILRHRLQASNQVAWISLTFCLCVLAISLTAPLSRALAWLYFIILCSITFGAPAILGWAQQHKNILRGPWDIAVPKVN